MSESSSTRPIVIASRASKLAEAQTYIVRDALQAKHPNLTINVALMSTEGDKNQAQALYVLGGKSLWTKELEVALLQNEVDILVHSLKDVPTVLPDGCQLGAILEREDPADSLVVKQGLPYATLDDLPPGSVVGTSSVRRVAQLKRSYPSLVFKDVVRLDSIYIYILNYNLSSFPPAWQSVSLDLFFTFIKETKKRKILLSLFYFILFDQ